jgi:hypothetical protein
MTVAGGEVESGSGGTYTTCRGLRPCRYIKRERGELCVEAHRNGAIGGGATTARRRSGQQGAALAGQRVAPRRGLPPGPAHKEEQHPV